MTTSNDRTPPHGTPARYRGTRNGSRPPCHCRPCVDSHTKACAERLLANSSGRSLRVPAGPVAEHITALLGRGMSRVQISIAAGVSKATVTNIAAGKNEKINRPVAEKILAVQPQIVRATDRVPFIGTQRRIQALYAIGHGPASVSLATGVSAYNLWAIAAGERGAVTAATYRAIRAAYRQLICTPGHSARARKAAARNGWLPPAAWGDIDNPNCKPDPTVIGVNFLERAAIRREEIIHLAWCGHQPEQILDRLNGEVSISTVRQIVQEWRTGVKRQRPERVRPERQKQVAA
ncbi:helix-turn-helix domain-containing protein [Streptomyces sp. cg35]|uniref:helix-turn-helix domain-containing protein n=1 Tax=Streptomyces sp. cg35 TaxID=3421650 RepID=UPI003D16A300